jgi:predicted GNAT superfamily acetyltransferase
VTYSIKILETPHEMSAVEELQRLVWPDSETDIVPGHMLRAAVHHGGLVIGAVTRANQPFQPAELEGELELAGFVFGFAGFYATPDGPRLQHCSHMLGVHPQHRNRGVGYLLKRAQWQMVRHQGIDRITWTYDPLLSVNAQLNIGKLGGVCNRYLPDFYGAMRDELNIGLPSDRFEVDWWVNSRRVNHRLGKRSRPQLGLAQYLPAEPILINPVSYIDNQPEPVFDEPNIPANQEALALVEIPTDFYQLRRTNPSLAKLWREQTRKIFLGLFEAGYLITDFVHQPMNEESEPARSFYIASHGESTL